MSSGSNPAAFAAGVAATFQLIRVSIELISTATSAEGKKEAAIEKGANGGSRGEKKKTTTDSEKEATAPLLKSSNSYGTLSTLETGAVTGSGGGDENGSLEVILGPTALEKALPVSSLLLHILVFFYLVAASFLTLKHEEGALYNSSALNAAAGTVCLGLLVSVMDYRRRRFGAAQRFFYLLAALLLLLGCLGVHTVNIFSSSLKLLDRITLVILIIYFGLSLLEIRTFRYPHTLLETASTKKKKPVLSRRAIFTMLKPYFWPDATADSALMNRIRAILTWVCVLASKLCNVTSPIILGWASTALTRHDYTTTIRYSILYSVVALFGSAFREGQSLVYLRVAQAAFVQLSEYTFYHLHSLSLDWHLRKKLGEVIRSMDRGIAACDTLMKYLFLMLIPALVECLVVCIIFATYFDYLPLAIAVFYFVFVYIVWTILVTLWRKKFRKAVVVSDNEWHDRCTDSLINFETVKYFTAEQYEMKRFGDSVKRYQSGSVSVQASLSLLNITQRLILQSCLAVALSLATLGIQKRMDCCVAHGCDSGNSQCCSDLSSTCTGMEVGDFVAVLTYTINLFQPLNFLGTVYNAIVMAIIDLTNLSELLAENPDIIDAPDAMPLPKTNETDDPDVAVEFDNVVFHYPTQPSTKGLKGLSFTMKRGTTTAIVGPTGAGKTTVSRLLFRFYDVLGGAVKVNGVDVRTVSQKSLRSSMGVVPQSASMFNDTLRENVLYGKRDATEDDLNQAANDAQLMDFIQSLDDGWETMVGDRGLKLSGGEKQRTAIARCLLKDPPFVVLDEATSALDTLTENSIQEALDRLGSDRTVLVIAHRLGTIRNADNIVVLKDGVVAEQGTHEDLLEMNGLYAEMWNMQLHSTHELS